MSLMVFRINNQLADISWQFAVISKKYGSKVQGLRFKAYLLNYDWPAPILLLLSLLRHKHSPS